VKELVEYVAKSLVDDPSQVEVSVEPSGNLVVLKLHVAPDDAGRVIGKDGRVASAIRVLLRAMAAREGKRVALKID
jgi:predicted RNA-binding protein YlqC (UPF0109 family)